MYSTIVAKVGRSGFGRFAPSCSPIRMFQTSCRSGSFHTACCAGMTTGKSTICDSPARWGRGRRKLLPQQELAADLDQRLAVIFDDVGGGVGLRPALRQ